MIIIWLQGKMENAKRRIFSCTHAKTISLLKYSQVVPIYIYPRDVHPKDQQT
uniref:Uncharacterized protein n=1 Tax=Rhizophora mucronata TaxID=61149 RepID=A0A2P2NF39_RHIMU